MLGVREGILKFPGGSRIQPYMLALILVSAFFWRLGTFNTEMAAAMPAPVRLMPDILRVRGFRFFFFSREGQEPRHVHVEQAARYAKFGLEPIELVQSRGFRGSELREIHSLIADHRAKFIIALG